MNSNVNETRQRSTSSGSMNVPFDCFKSDPTMAGPLIFPTDPPIVTIAIPAVDDLLGKMSVAYARNGVMKM